MIRPLGDNVVIKRLEPEEKTKGGIVLTERETKRFRRWRRFLP